ncbi:hypothetical protein PGT21_034386 [Puccinia graminis f. sp. tritici]|uniref:Uncharacterized protein n=1 Tax=Puccinia graminis f. sp. tritici TaxID=56615 RepID=A0A5B0PMU8_PUCGR|nr:hypothetical protein PGT21_034386 [Puccinia graminis f. sp. tritici]
MTMCASTVRESDEIGKTYLPFPDMQIFSNTAPDSCLPTSSSACDFCSNILD